MSQPRENVSIYSDSIVTENILFPSHAKLFGNHFKYSQVFWEKWGLDLQWQVGIGVCSNAGVDVGIDVGISIRISFALALVLLLVLVFELVLALVWVSILMSVLGLVPAWVLSKSK